MAVSVLFRLMDQSFYLQASLVAIPTLNVEDLA
ncbi:hypothetical protein GWI33_009500, partial [Rhynchophorus ferrugineus]